ncbi:MAG: hypothetical protein LBG91_03370 [Treponema sp.]|jgi:hypothetical protein|nr:hypothetical protein [Treponema sp.]
MKICEVKEIKRKDVPIYYRKLYTGIAVIETIKGPSDYRIDFIIEYKPTGQKDIIITFVDQVDYPLVPLNKELKKFIDDLDFEGGLPD